MLAFSSASLTISWYINSGFFDEFNDFDDLRNQVYKPNNDLFNQCVIL